MSELIVTFYKSILAHEAETNKTFAIAPVHCPSNICIVNGHRRSKVGCLQKSRIPTPSLSDLPTSIVLCSKSDWISLL